MRGSVAKKIRRAAEAAIEGTDKLWFDHYVENEKMRNPESGWKYLQGMDPEKMTEVLKSGWAVTGPRMYSEGCGKDLYKSMKQTYKRSARFFGRSQSKSIRMLGMAAAAGA